MIIDRDGKILEAWCRIDGPVIEDKDNQYNIKFGIALAYNKQQKEMYSQIRELKHNLESTDYKAIKYADGAYTEEEYAPIRAERAAWRAEINRIEETFVEPTLTRAEIDEAEDKVMKRIKAQIEMETGKEVEELTGGELE